MESNTRTPFEPNASTIEPFFRDVLISNSSYDANPPADFLFIDALTQIYTLLLNENTKPFRKLLDWVLVLDKDKIFPALQQLLQNIPELAELDGSNHGIMISITFDNLTNHPIVKFYSLSQNAQEIHTFSEVEYAKFITQDLIVNLEGTNLFIIFVSQQMEVIKATKATKKEFDGLPDYIGLLLKHHETSLKIVENVNKIRNLNKMVKLFLYKQKDDLQYKSINLFSKMLFMNFFKSAKLLNLREGETSIDYQSIFAVFGLFTLMFLQSKEFQPKFEYTAINPTGLQIIKEYSWGLVSTTIEGVFRSFVSEEYRRYVESRETAKKTFALQHMVRHGGAIKTQKTTKHVKSIKKIIKKINKNQSKKGNINNANTNFKNNKSKKLKQKKKLK